MSKIEIKKIIKQQGYGPIENSIKKSADDLKKAGYNREEILDTLYSIFDTEDEKIKQVIKNI